MAQDTDDINLTPQELQTLSELDSRQFGFLKLNSPEQAKRKAVVVRAIKYLERMLVQAQAEKQRRKADITKASSDESKENEDEDKGISIDPKTYCKLGHFHLLLEDYNKAMSAYQKFYSLKGDYWKDASFLYGLGLVYFHFNAFQWEPFEKIAGNERERLFRCRKDAFKDVLSTGRKETEMENACRVRPMGKTAERRS